MSSNKKPAQHKSHSNLSLGGHLLSKQSQNQLRNLGGPRPLILRKLSNNSVNSVNSLALKISTK